MNAITVADILKLDIMKGYRLAAGEKGLSRQIHYINVCDNPLSETDNDIQVFPGEISLTFFYYGRKDPSYLYYTLELLISRNAAALIVFDEYFKEMPEDFTARCDQVNLPLIFVDCKTPYALIISSIIEYRVQAEQEKNIEDKLSAIVSHRTSEDEKMQLTSDLNPNFQNNILVLFALKPGSEDDVSGFNMEMMNLCNTLSHDYRFFAAKYRSGVLAVLSCSDNRLSDISSSAESAVKIIRKYLPDAAIGVSNVCHLAELGTAISQSYMALQGSRLSSQQVFAYRDLGVARILLDLAGTPALEDFYDDITGPITKYDTKTNSQLLDTMLRFAANDMDYRKTAAAMFVHENTIRYRIEKIKELIPYGISEMDFYETISVTAKIHRLKHT